jgi:hypothetical protein
MLALYADSVDSEAFFLFHAFPMGEVFGCRRC